MTTRTSGTAAAYFKPKFKPIAGGYLFEAPSPWIFGPSRRYIVTEEQKSLLVGVLTPRRPALALALMTVAILAFASGAVILCGLLSAYQKPTALGLVAIIVTILAPLYAALVTIRGVLRRIEPIVAAAVPTQAKFSPQDRVLAVGNAMPTTILKLGVVVWTFSALRGIIALTVPASVPFLGKTHVTMFDVVISLLLAVFNAYILYKRRAQKGVLVRES